MQVHSLQSATPPRAGSCYTEEDWNDDSTIENGEWYPLSKVGCTIIVLHSSDAPSNAQQ